MSGEQKSSHNKSNLETAHQLYEAIFSGDWKTFDEVTTDDFAVIEADGMPYGGEWKGVDGFQKLFGAMNETYFSGLDIVQQTVMTDGERVVALFKLSGIAQPSGIEVDTEIAEVTEFKDGLVHRLKPFYWDTKAIAEAFG